MKIEQIREIADAVLYEGYLLYPYRQSAIKNCQRWTFGVIYPQEYSETSGGTNSCNMRTECLVELEEQPVGNTCATVDVYVRFLHLVTCIVLPDMDKEQQIDRMSVDEWSSANRSTNDTWEEAVERELKVRDLCVSDLVAHPQRREFAFPGNHIVENIADSPGKKVIREQQSVAGVLTVTSEQVGKNLFKLTIAIENTTRSIQTELERYEEILPHCFISTHIILQAQQASFVSLLEFPDRLKETVQSCANSRTWPVLVGKQGERDAMLSSPIILYDYPQIAPESVGALFDGTEIDEILMLRIMTLTDKEKQEIRQGDSKARELLDRAETLSHDQLMQLHGAIRDLRLVDIDGIEHEKQTQSLPASVDVMGDTAKIGDAIRLHPTAHADAFDLLLKGKTARIEDIKQDFEDRTYLVVTVDDDPGREQTDERVMPGHRFFFFPEEVELLKNVDSKPGRTEA